MKRMLKSPWFWLGVFAMQALTWFLIAMFG